MLTLTYGVIGWCDGAGLGVLRIWISVGQGPTALAVGTGVALFGHLSFPFFSPRLWVGCLFCLRLNDPLRQYFSLYRAVF